MKSNRVPTGLPAHRFEPDPWRLVESEYDGSSLGATETLFAVGNGYLGLRANQPEGREAHTHGTFLNGFHETWRIHHAEDAFAFAKTGQTIVNAPDAKLMKLYVDDEPLLIPVADLIDYEQALDFRAGTWHREVEWRTPSGCRVRIRAERLVSFEHRHLAVMSLEVTLIDQAAPVVVSSQLLNRQDGEDEYHVPDAALGEGRDPRQARGFTHRVLLPQLARHDPDSGDGGQVILGYRCANSGMTVAAGYQHVIQTGCTYRAETSVSEDLAKTVLTFDGRPGETIRITKFASYHSSRGVPAQELGDRCGRTLERAVELGADAVRQGQRAWLDDYWERSDIEIEGDPDAQTAIRWNLFQLAQASARAQEQGIAAKAVTGNGYEGHYFWDTEVYVVPALAYTSPDVARRLIRFRWSMLPAARRRATEMSQRGALYPWRTINGEEASAYYAAGTAQYHINAAVVYALERYLFATGDVELLAGEGAEILVETARLWEDLGFFDHAGDFHIHGVTGPDEYTTVVNDNLYTNAMARFSLRYAAETVRFLAGWDAEAYQRLCRRTGLVDSEIEAWKAAADAMFLPYDDKLGIHPQDAGFLARERWPFEDTPAEKYPLLLNFHPLVIYRHQVLKQADVVLAMYLEGEHFTEEEKRRNFDYYDPITTGDSSLSACVQAIVAAEVGHPELSFDYFRHALYLDLCDTHGNTADGVHVASVGGVWAGIVHGFAGLSDDGERLAFRPRLPADWSAVSFRLHRHGSRLEVRVAADAVRVRVLDGPACPILIGDTVHAVEAGHEVTC